MAKVNLKKELKPLTDAINDWTCKNFGLKTKLGEDFQALVEKKTIYYALVVCEEGNNTFLKDVAIRYPDVKADYFLWCLMHEIGHCMTDDMWTEEEQDWYATRLETINSDDFPDTEERSFWYYSLPNEFFATRWAGEYMMSYPKEVAKFWNKIQPMILEFYEKFGLTNE
jgi:hypothetical protein